MSMKIGILSFEQHANYGGILQSYALQTILERMGHQVMVFNRPIRYRKCSFGRSCLRTFKRIVKKYFLHRRGIRVFAEKYEYKYQLLNTKYTAQFVRQHSHTYYVEKLTDIKNEFDAIIVGSDQIWRMEYFKGSWHDDRAADAFLAFTDGWNIKRIAYAASFGQSSTDISDEELADCKNHIQKFDAVSVREESGLKICRDTLGRNDVKWVLDPTMLLSIEDYMSLIPADKITSALDKPFLMSYVLDDNSAIDSLIHAICNSKGLDESRFKTYEQRDAPLDDCTRRPVEDFLLSIAQASYVLTDSFHACVFSILFHRPFAVIVNKDRGVDRFLSLLKIFGLEDRMLFSVYDYKPLPDINYNRVDDILVKKRRDSMEFLRNSLNK